MEKPKEATLVLRRSATGRALLFAIPLAAVVTGLGVGLSLWAGDRVLTVFALVGGCAVALHLFYDYWLRQAP